MESEEPEAGSQPGTKSEPEVAFSRGDSPMKRGSPLAGLGDPKRQPHVGRLGVIRVGMVARVLCVTGGGLMRSIIRTDDSKPRYNPKEGKSERSRSRSQMMP